MSEFGLRMNGQNLTKFCIHIIIDKIYVGIIKHHFRRFSTELRPSIDVGIWFLLNILRMNGQNLTKLYIKSVGYYVIPSVQKFAFKCSSIHLSVRPNSCILRWL